MEFLRKTHVKLRFQNKPKCFRAFAIRHHLQDAIRRMFAYLELVAAPKLRELLLQLCNFINE